jgi:hypothetical protein
MVYPAHFGGLILARVYDIKRKPEAFHLIKPDSRKKNLNDVDLNDQ